MPAADLVMARTLEHEKRPLTQVEQASMGAFCDVRNKIAFRRQRPCGNDKALDWHIPLFGYAGSAVYAWPVRKVKVPNHDSYYFECKEDLEDVSRLCFFDWKGLHGQRFRWRSPAWQREYWRLSGLPPAVRAVAEGQEMSMQALCAWAAFFGMDIVVVKMIARVLGIHLGPNCSLFDVIITLIMRITGCSLDRALEVARTRLPFAMDEEELAVDEMMEVDEAMDCLDVEDIKRVKERQARIKQAEEEQDTYVEDFAEAMVKRRKEKQKGPDGAPLAKKPRVGDRRKLPAAIPMQDQAAIKAWFPPDTLVWKSRAAASWHCRVSELPEHSRSVRKHGDKTIPLLVSLAWKDSCFLQGIPLSECEVSGLVFE